MLYPFGIWTPMYYFNDGIIVFRLCCRCCEVSTSLSGKPTVILISDFEWVTSIWKWTTARSFVRLQRTKDQLNSTNIFENCVVFCVFHDCFRFDRWQLLGAQITKKLSNLVLDCDWSGNMTLGNYHALPSILCFLMIQIYTTEQHIFKRYCIQSLFGI